MFGIDDLVMGGLSLAGSLFGASAAERAGDTQANASLEAARLQKAQYDETRGDLAPWRNAGNVALSQLSNLTTGPNAQLLKPFGMEDFRESPAYQFNLDQGLKAIDKASAARGRFYAPATLQDVGKFSQGLASNEFMNAYNMYNTNMSNIWNRLYSLSGTGQNAAAQTGAFGATMANNVGNNLVGAGNAQASGMVGAANALSGGVGNAVNNYMLGEILARNQKPTIPSPSERPMEW